MREIKFRAWDTYKKKMIRRFLVDDFELGINFDGTVIGYVNNFDEDESNELAEYPDRFIPMQYTGLKDKNGVEIYEGDIVKCFNDGLSEVVFKKGCFGLLTHGEKGTDYYTFDEVYGYCEILGNRYENPELMEGANG